MAVAHYEGLASFLIPVHIGTHTLREVAAAVEHPLCRGDVLMAPLSLTSAVQASLSAFSTHTAAAATGFGDGSTAGTLLIDYGRQLLSCTCGLIIFLLFASGPADGTGAIMQLYYYDFARRESVSGILSEVHQ